MGRVIHVLGRSQEIRGRGLGVRCAVCDGDDAAEDLDGGWDAV